jgi:hypothetical protein
MNKKALAYIHRTNAFAVPPSLVIKNPTQLDNGLIPGELTHFSPPAPKLPVISKKNRVCFSQASPSLSHHLDEPLLIIAFFSL